MMDLKHYRKHLFKSTKPGIVYIISIIDYLQLYNFKKYMETSFKIYFVSPKDSDKISSVPPEPYSTRFINYMKKISRMENVTRDNRNTEF